MWIRPGLDKFRNDTSFFLRESKIVGPIEHAKTWRAKPKRKSDQEANENFAFCYSLFSK